MASGVFLTVTALAKRWGMSHRTLDNWRYNKGPDGKPAPKGPAFIKVGAKVLYPLEAVEQWEQRNKVGE